MINQVNDMDSTRMNDGQTAERRSFSIVVPCYNAEKTLAACLKSFLDSGYPGDKLELIVADDGSSDLSFSIASELGAKVVRTKGRRGPAAARNLGAQAAAMDYLLFVDSDIVAPPDTIWKFNAAIARFHDFTVIQAILSEGEYGGLFSRYLHSWFYYFYRLRSNYRTMTMSSGCVAMPREIFFRAGKFNPGLRSNEDTELGYRLACLGAKILICTDIEVLHDSEHSLRTFIRRNFFVHNFMLVRLTYGMADITDSNPEYRVPILNILISGVAVAIVPLFAVLPPLLPAALLAGLFLYQLFINRRFLTVIRTRSGWSRLPGIYAVLQLDNFVKLAGMLLGAWDYFVRKKHRAIREYAQNAGIEIKPGTLSKN